MSRVNHEVAWRTLGENGSSPYLVCILMAANYTLSLLSPKTRDDAQCVLHPVPALGRPNIDRKSEAMVVLMG